MRDMPGTAVTLDCLDNWTLFPCACIPVCGPNTAPAATRPLARTLIFKSLPFPVLV